MLGPGVVSIAERCRDIRLGRPSPSNDRRDHGPGFIPVTGSEQLLRSGCPTQADLVWA
jgi:hypothetical protein